MKTKVTCRRRIANCTIQFWIIKHSVLLFFTIILLALDGCIQNVELDFQGFESNIVLNCVLTPDSIVRVKITESVRAENQETFTSVNELKVTINNSTTEMILNHVGNGEYVSDNMPESGKKYKLLVEGQSIKNLEAVTTIPTHLDVSVKLIPENDILTIRIKDDPDQKNYYWICKKNYYAPRREFEYETYLSSDYLLLDDFNRIRGEDLSGVMNFSYHFFARLEDVNFNGKEVVFELSHRFTEQYEGEFRFYKRYLYIFNADEHLDKYMKSALIQYELGVIGDMPVFHTPIDMYSNIENGKGIFGSYTLSQFDITTP